MAAVDKRNSEICRPQTIDSVVPEYFRMYLLSIVAAGVVLICLSRYTDVDLRVADWMYDFPSQRFPWNESWIAAVVMHRWVKVALIGFGLVLFFCLAADNAFGMRWFEAGTRHRLYVVVLSSAFVPFVISLLKSFSIHACPWNLVRYGGHAPYLRLFEHLPGGVPAGHCFPAGHASSALWICAFAVFWLPKHPRASMLAFFVLSIPGLVLGWMQQLRGAHFLTHTLWSMWITGLVICLITLCIFTQFNDQLGPCDSSV